MPSEVPRERLQDIVTNIDRVRAHLKGMQPDAELDDKTRDAVRQLPLGAGDEVPQPGQAVPAGHVDRVADAVAAEREQGVGEGRSPSAHHRDEGAAAGHGELADLGRGAGGHGLLAQEDGPDGPFTNDRQGSRHRGQVHRPGDLAKGEGQPVLKGGVHDGDDVGRGSTVRAGLLFTGCVHG